MVSTYHLYIQVEFMKNFKTKLKKKKKKKKKKKNSLGNL